MLNINLRYAPKGQKFFKIKTKNFSKYNRLYIIIIMKIFELNFGKFIDARLVT